MNLLIRTILIGLVALSSLDAQTDSQEPEADPVLEAIKKIKSKGINKPNEVIVVLDPPEESPAPEAQAKSKDVTPPNSSGPDAEEAKVTAPAEPAAKAREGLSVRVEKLKTGSGMVDPSKVKLMAPFPAKPLASAPTGWRFESAENVPPFTREVELSAGKKITLSIRPHLLVPEADGVKVFHVMEPGFDSSLGYQQNSTVGAILATSIRQLDEDSKHMGVAIDKLQQLLSSLPKPEPAPPTTPPDPKPAKFRSK